MRNYIFVLVWRLVLVLLQNDHIWSNGQFNEASLNQVVSNPGMSDTVKNMAMSSMNTIKKEDMMFLRAGVDTKDMRSTRGMKAMFTATKTKAMQMAEEERSRNKIIHDLSELLGVSPSTMASTMNTLMNMLGVQIENLGTRDDNCDNLVNVRCDRQAKYRTADGSCNNLNKPLWGQAFIPMRRFQDPAYDDGVSLPRTKSVRGEDLPSAREVSFTVHESDESTRKNGAFTHILMQWGQFLDHDITSTPINSGAAGSNAGCCMDDISEASKSQIDMNPEDRDICFPIRIPRNDPSFFRSNCMNFVRSIQISNSNCNPAPAEQMNQVTAYIDGSAIYGSSDDEMRNLRTLNRGLLKTARHRLLPEDDQPSCLLTKSTDFCFKAGDVRVNEQMALASIHTVFMREHNRVARELASLNPNWDDEKLFQEARKIVAAKMQHITYSEFLPSVLGNSRMNQFNMRVKRRGFKDDYSDRTDASIRNVFAAAAYRFGHTLVKSMFSQLGRGYQPEEEVLLVSSFGNTSHIIKENGDGLNKYLRGMVTDAISPADRFVTPMLTERLFEDGNGNRLDLISINIQRGRDHGLPSYNTWRRWCGLPEARDWNGLTDHPQHAVRKLQQVYSDPNDIDLFSGGVSENRANGALIGPTFACIVSHQFKALKEGDRFWYERNDRNTGFSVKQLNVIKETTLAKVLCDNTDIIQMQPRAFRVPRRKNERQSCEQLSQPWLNEWTENPLPTPPPQTQPPRTQPPHRGFNSSWDDWGQWGECRGGRQTRRRQCNPGFVCLGQGSQDKACGSSNWSEWGQWTACSGDIRTRHRTCTGLTGRCPGSDTQINNCTDGRGVGDSSWGPWGNWTRCKKGRRRRRRRCLKNNSNRKSKSCIGPRTERSSCSNSGVDCSIYTRYVRQVCERTRG